MRTSSSWSVRCCCEPPWLRRHWRHNMPMLEVLAFTVLGPAAAHVSTPVLKGWHSDLLEASAVAARGVGAAFEPDAGAACKDAPGSGAASGDRPGSGPDAEQQPLLQSAECRSEAAQDAASTMVRGEAPPAASATQPSPAAAPAKRTLTVAKRTSTVAKQNAACDALLPLRALMRAVHVLGRERSDHIRLQQLQVIALGRSVGIHGMSPKYPSSVLCEIYRQPFWC